jgi:hypothetical protein
VSTQGITPIKQEDRWDWLLEIPWGVCVYLVLVVVGGFVWTLVSSELEAGDYLVAVGSGAGLLAVGHGIRSHGRATVRRSSSRANDTDA